MNANRGVASLKDFEESNIEDRQADVNHGASSLKDFDETDVASDVTAQLDALKAENARLRKALAFYADNENWYREYELTRDSGMSPVYVPIERSRIEHDGGTIAREALQEAQS